MCVLFFPTKLQKLVKLSNLALIFTAKLVAIYKALFFAKSENINNIIIFTVSNAALIALKKPKVTANNLVFKIIGIGKILGLLVLD